MPVLGNPLKTPSANKAKINLLSFSRPTSSRTRRTRPMVSIAERDRFRS
jgi:hypothetical protein